jgi:hypothetical protein
MRGIAKKLECHCSSESLNSIYGMQSDMIADRLRTERIEGNETTDRIAEKAVHWLGFEKDEKGKTVMHLNDEKETMLMTIRSFDLIESTAFSKIDHLMLIQ